MGGWGTHVRAITIAGESWAGVQVMDDHPPRLTWPTVRRWAIITGRVRSRWDRVRFAQGRVEGSSLQVGYSEDAGEGARTRGTRLPRKRCAGSHPKPRGANGSPSPLAPTASVAAVCRSSRACSRRGCTDGYPRVRRDRGAQRDRHRAASAGGEERPPSSAATNDCIFYGGHARYLVDAADRSWRAWQTACRHRIRGLRNAFYDIFKRYDNDSIRSTRCCSARARCGDERCERPDISRRRSR